ncbi:MAG TPA: sigma-70 family RNA polymerase sigma factor [Acidobacteriaceae bacterium]|nr:sigma-70 family RNA polymerase sigma factor [Acidobacteriaceae bacterium]
MFDFDSQREFAQSPKVVATRRAKQSVESRQRDIYDSHRHRTFALAYYMTGNEIEAETILTASFVRAFQAKKEPEAQEIDAALLQELREREHLQQDAPAVAGAASSEPTSGDLSGRNVKRTDLEEAIRELPATERLLFLLRDVEGYTSAVIAKLMGMQEAEVNRNLLKARLHLRRILAEAAQGDEEKAA